MRQATVHWRSAHVRAATQVSHPRRSYTLSDADPNHVRTCGDSPRDVLVGRPQQSCQRQAIFMGQVVAGNGGHPVEVVEHHL